MGRDAPPGSRALPLAGLKLSDSSTAADASMFCRGRAAEFTENDDDWACWAIMSWYIGRLAASSVARDGSYSAGLAIDALMMDTFKNMFVFECLSMVSFDASLTSTPVGYYVRKAGRQAKTMKLRIDPSTSGHESRRNKYPWADHVAPPTSTPFLTLPSRVLTSSELPSGKTSRWVTSLPLPSQRGVTRPL